MKKILLFSLVLCGTVSFAQQLELSDKKLQDFRVQDLMQQNQDRTVTCGSDTVLYVTAKATGNSGLSINNATSAYAYAQYFDAPQDINVEGFQFIANKADETGGTSINVQCELYLAAADSTPTGAALATATVAVDTNFYGGNFVALTKTAIFGTAVTVSQPYLIVVTNNDPNSIVMYSSDYNAGDGGGEWLGSGNLFGTWTRSWGLVVGGTPYDADMFMHPIVNYDLSTDFDVSPDCGTPGTITVTSTSSPNLSNRMYSSAVYFGAAGDQYNWDWADASPVENGLNPSHVYAAAGPYDIIAVDTLFGWTSTCTETMTKSTCSGSSSIDDNELTFNVYPNPAVEQIQLTSSSEMTAIRIYDVSGKLIETISTINGTTQVILELAHYEVGSYIAEIETISGNGQARFVKK